MLSPTWLALTILAAGPWSAQDVRAIGYLWSPDNSQHCLYEPQEGDILMTTSKQRTYAIIWALAGTGHPYHSAIVVRRSTGKLDLFEIGGGSSHSVTLRALPERLTDLFQDYVGLEAAAWIRRRKTPLSREQSAKLTEFAEAQLGKRFAPRPEFLGLVPTRGRVYRSGDPKQPTWICSEMVLSAIEQAGILPAGAISNPGRLSPQHLFYDRGIDLSGCWGPPLLWTGDETPPPEHRHHPKLP